MSEDKSESVKKAVENFSKKKAAEHLSHDQEVETEWAKAKENGPSANELEEAHQRNLRDGLE